MTVKLMSNQVQFAGYTPHLQYNNLYANLDLSLRIRITIKNNYTDKY